MVLFLEEELGMDEELAKRFLNYPISELII